MVIETRVLELEVGKAEEGASAEEKGGYVPLYKGCEYQNASSRALKHAYSQGIIPKRRLDYPRPC